MSNNEIFTTAENGRLSSTQIDRNFEILAEKVEDIENREFGEPSLTIDVNGLITSISSDGTIVQQEPLMIDAFRVAYEYSEPFFQSERYEPILNLEDAANALSNAALAIQPYVQFPVSALNLLPHEVRAARVLGIDIVGTSPLIVLLELINNEVERQIALFRQIRVQNGY